MTNLTEEYGRNKITFININENESDDELIIEANEKKESIEEIRKRTIIYLKSSKYMILSKVNFKIKNSHLVEFNDKNSIDKIMVKKNKIYFKGKKLKMIKI